MKPSRLLHLEPKVTSQLKLRFFMRLKYVLHLLSYYLFKFESWHISPIESREYCLDVVSYINDHVCLDDFVVEIGCGLGETINRINSNKRCGYDLSSQVISAAKIHHMFSKTEFQVGSFASLTGQKIKYLIALNFLHDFDNVIVASWLDEIISNNEISYFVVDEVADPAYKNNHNFSKILPHTFLLLESIGQEYRYNRTLKVFKYHGA